MIIIGFTLNFWKMSKKNTHKSTNEIFIGLEYIYPDIDLLSKVRLVLKRLASNSCDNTAKFNDFFNLIETLETFPITPYLKNLLSSSNSHEKIIATYKLMDHLSYDPDYENFRLLLKHFHMDEDQNETLEKILIQWLKDKASQPQYSYCEKLADLLLERDFFEKTQKIVDLYNCFQKNSVPDQQPLKNLPLTPYLKNLLSSSNSHEKIIATYKLMDHLSYDPDYENFRLLLKHFHMDEDQNETLEKILIQWLKDKASQPQYSYCEKLADLLLERDFFEKTQKIVDLYNCFQKNSVPDQQPLKNLPLTPYLKNLLSSSNSHEKIIATYKLMDHLSYDPDYENFRLLLKHFHMDEDQNETLEKILIQWLKDKASQPQYSYCEKLADLLLERDFFEKTQKIVDLYNCFQKNSVPDQKPLKNLPLTPYLKNLLSSSNSHEKIIATYKLMDHLSYDPDYENFRLLLKHFHMDEDQNETLEKILIQWLKDKASQPQYSYCEKLADLLLERDFFEKTQKIVDLYNCFQKNSVPDQKPLKNLPLTPYLKNLLSSSNSHEKIIATYKLMDHLSYDPDYENFRLLLKHFHMDEDQNETLEKILIQWLKDKASQPQYSYCEKLADLLLERDFFEKTQKIVDLYNCFQKNSVPDQKPLKNLPLTPYLKNLLSSSNSHEKIIATYKLMDHLSYDPDYENFRLLLKHFHMDEDQNETLEKILIQWLKDKASQPQYSYCEKLADLLLEQDFFEKTQKTINLYNVFYQNSTPQLQNLKNLPLTKHLKTLLSANNPQEKIIAMYKFMDHIENNTQYEKFRLLLKHSPSENETLEKILIQWLKDKASQPQYSYCEKLADLLLEQDSFEKTQKTINLYNVFYQNSTPQLQNLKTFPLQNI